MIGVSEVIDATFDYLDNPTAAPTHNPAQQNAKECMPPNLRAAFNPENGPFLLQTTAGAIFQFQSVEFANEHDANWLTLLDAVPVPAFSQPVTVRDGFDVDLRLSDVATVAKSIDSDKE